MNNKKRILFLTAGSLVLSLFAVYSNLSPLKGIVASESRYTLTISKDSNVHTTNEFALTTYEHNEHASFTFSSIKSQDSAIGVLEANSTIIKNEAANDLDVINLTFTGGEVSAYTRFLEGDTHELRYNLTSGVNQNILGNYIRIEVGNSPITLTSLSLTYGCEEEDDRPLDPIELLPKEHNTLKIEAETAATSTVPGEEVLVGTEGKTLEQTNNPSGGAFIYKLNSLTASFTTLTYFVEADEAGLAILSFTLGLNTSRSLANMFTVQLNGVSQTIYDENIKCPSYSGVQYYDWTKISAYALNLNEGVNTITLIVGTLPLNIDFIELESEINLSAVNSFYTTYDAVDNISTTSTRYIEGVVGEKYSGYYGSTANNTFVYKVNVEEAATAKLLIVGGRNKALTPAQNISELTVNSSANDVILEDHTNKYNSWEIYYEVSLAIIKLNKGENTISLTFMSGQSTNFAGISFIATESVTVVTNN